MKTVNVTDLEKPTQVVNFATILPLAKATDKRVNVIASREQPAGIRLIPTSPGRPAQLRFAKPVSGRGERLTQIEARRFSTPRASGVISRAFGASMLTTVGVAELDLPPGMPRYVNVATLKRMLRADASEVLLKRGGDRWEVCGDSLQVDLLDGTVEFRLGTVQIWS